MRKPESGLVNETHSILWDSKIQTDHQTLAKRLDLVIVNEKNKEESLPS